MLPAVEEDPSLPVLQHCPSVPIFQVWWSGHWLFKGHAGFVWGTVVKGQCTLLLFLWICLRFGKETNQE
jgi:hypothetical protein